jgi:hypothetical protein
MTVDAPAAGSYGAVDAIITNPPYIRAPMHRMIAHFQRIAPTWLLLETGWAQTKQASPFMASCSDIVAIGRVKWIEGSKHTGKDNYAWYRFDASHTAGVDFHAANRAKRSLRGAVRASSAARLMHRSELAHDSAQELAGRAHAAVVLALHLALQSDAPPAARHRVAHHRCQTSGGASVGGWSRSIGNRENHKAGSR